MTERCNWRSSGLVLLLSFGASCAAADPSLAVGPAFERLAERLVRVTDAGLTPPDPGGLEEGRGGLLFYNETRAEIITVLFPEMPIEALGCRYSRGFSAADGAGLATSPLQPGAAASLCLHRNGAVPYQVHTLSGRVFHGMVTVAPEHHAEAEVGP